MRKLKLNFVALATLVLGTAVFMACSNEENTKTPDNSLMNYRIVIEDEIDEMFYEYVNSDEFINYYSTVENFNYLLNYDWLERFTTEEEMFEWIEDNFLQTNFRSFEEAQAKWSNINYLSREIDLNFPHIEEFILDNPIGIISDKIEKWFPNDVVSANSTCNNSLRACRKAASDRYAEAAQEIANQLANEEISEIVASHNKNIAMTQYTNEIKDCVSAYNSCINN